MVDTLKLSEQIRKKYELGDAMHMTSVDNLNSIFNLKKICSKNSLKVLNTSCVDISNESVQSIRATKIIPTSQKLVHDYVPFYWGKKTPMVATLKDSYESLIFLLFSTDLLTNYECVICNGNAASHGTTFKTFNQLSDLDMLTPKSINTHKYASDDNIKNQKQSELLVHDFIGLEHLRCIICYTENVKKKVKELADTHRIKCGVYCNRAFYY